jgi:restriction system protein
MGSYPHISHFGHGPSRGAVRYGAGPIELVDGKKLVSMFETLQLGLKPKTIYEIDQAFFQEFR